MVRTLMALLLFLQLNISSQYYICTLESKGEFWVSEMISFNQTMTFHSVQPTTEHRNISVSFNVPLSQNIVEGLLNGTLIGKIVSSIKSANSADIETVGEDCKATHPQSISCYDIPTSQSQNFSFYFNKTFWNSNLTNLTNVGRNLDSILNGTNDLCHFLPQYPYNFSNPYYSCRCFFNVTHQVGAVPRPPISVTYFPSSHSLDLGFVTPALVPTIWLRSDNIPWANCSKIFDDVTLSLFSSGNSDLPKCRWLDNDHKLPILRVYLARQSSLRPGHQLILRFSLQPIRSFLSRGVESNVPSNTALYSAWRFYSHEVETYQKMRSDNSKENVTSEKNRLINWNIDIISSSLPTRSPSLVPTCRPTTLPSLFPSIRPSNFPTLSQTHLPNSSPTTSPSRTTSKTPSFRPSVLPSSIEVTRSSRLTNSSDTESDLHISRITYSISFDCKTTNNNRIHLKVNGPGMIYSPCHEDLCVLQNLFPEDDLVLDASASISYSIFPLIFSWRILTVSADPLCLVQDCRPYTPEILLGTRLKIQYHLSSFGSSDIIRIPQYLLLAGTILKFGVQASLENVWCEDMVNISDSSVFQVIVTSSLIPTVVVDGFYSIQDTNNTPSLVWYENQSFIIDKVLHIYHIPYFVNPQLVLPSDFALFSSDSLEFLWELFSFSPSSPGNISVIKLMKNSSTFSFRFDEILTNLNEGYILRLAVKSSLYTSEWKSPIAAFLTFDSMIHPNPTIFGGSRCAHSDTPIILRGIDTIDRHADRLYKWSCWVVDTTNRDSYNIGENNLFDPSSQCSSGVEFNHPFQEITSFDRMKTLGDHVSGGCRGYQLSLDEKIQESSHEILKIPPGVLEIGVKYKICLEISYLDTLLTSAPFCIGIYIYIPLKTDAIHYTGVNKTTTSDIIGTRALVENSNSWQPYELLAPFLRLYRRTSNASSTYIMNSREILKLTFGMQTSEHVKNRPTCNGYLYPKTNWTYQPLLPFIYTDHLDIHDQKTSFEYPYSNSSFSFGYYSYEFPYNVFSSGLSYSFSLSSSCSLSDGTFSQRGFAELLVEIRHPPRNGRLEISPVTGIAFETIFSFRHHDWILQEDSDLPLQYSFYLSPNGNRRVNNNMEFICLQDWSEIPHIATTVPPQKESQTFFAIDALSFWNETYGFVEYHCPIATLSGYVKDTSGAESFLLKKIQICPPWKQKIQQISSTPSVASDLHSQYVAEFVETLQQYVNMLLTSQFQTIKLSKNSLRVFTYLYGLSVILNSYPVHFLHRQYHSLQLVRSELRKTIFYHLEFYWENVPDNLRSPSLYYHFILALVQLTAIPDEIEEILKIQIVELISNAVNSVGTQSNEVEYQGYFSSSFCASLYSSKVFETISDILTTLDRISPPFEQGNLNQTNIQSLWSNMLTKRQGIYKDTVLKLKNLMVGCSLPGERVGTGAADNSWQFNGTHNPHQFIPLNGTNSEINGTALNSSALPTLSPTWSQIRKSNWPEDLPRSGTQIGVLRQSVFDYFSEAAVTVGRSVNRLLETQLGNITYMTSNTSNKSIPIIFKTSVTNRESTSYLQLPCDTTRSKSCQLSTTQLTLSQKMKNEISIRDVFSLISHQDSVVDISILNVPLFQTSLSALDVDRSWIPTSKENSGVSDAVIVEFKSYEKINVSLFNLTTTIEVGVKVSRPDILWKLAVLGATELNSTKPPTRLLRYYMDQRDPFKPRARNKENIQVIFSPRWVRCELYDSTQEKWIQPEWLDGWWSPDVASFATEGELQNAANKYVANHFNTYTDTDHSRTKPQVGYLAGNSSFNQLPTSLSCFLNSISISSSWEVLRDPGIWLQWRTVSQTQDPCGGCSGHGICVLFRTSPICLCQTDYRGRFCDEHLSTNSTNSGTPSRQWYLHSPWSANGLRSVGYLLCIISMIVIFSQIIKRLILLMISVIDDPHPHYLISPVETETMTITRYAGSDPGQVHSNHPTTHSEDTWSFIDREGSLPVVFHPAVISRNPPPWSLFRILRQNFSSQTPFHSDDDENENDLRSSSNLIGDGLEIMNLVQLDQEEELPNNELPRTLVRGVSNFSQTSRTVLNGCHLRDEVQAKKLRQRKSTQN